MVMYRRVDDVVPDYYVFSWMHVDSISVLLCIIELKVSYIYVN